MVLEVIAIRYRGSCTVIWLRHSTFSSWIDLFYSSLFYSNEITVHCEFTATILFIVNSSGREVWYA